MIRTEQAIVLRGLDYGETSRIVTVLGEVSGKVTVMAKGARSVKSKFGAALQPMAFSQIVFYAKSGRSIQTLKEAAHVRRFDNIGRDLDKLAVGLRIVELVNALTQEGDRSDAIFSLTRETLTVLDSTHERTPNILPFYQLRFAAALGFDPQISKSDVERIDEGGGALRLDTGRVVPDRQPTPSSMRATRASLRAFATFAKAEADAILRMRMDADVYNEVQELIGAYFRYHVENAYPTRAERVTAQLFRS